MLLGYYQNNHVKCALTMRMYKSVKFSGVRSVGHVKVDRVVGDPLHFTAHHTCLILLVKNNHNLGFYVLVRSQILQRALASHS